MGQFEAHGDYSTIANCYIKCSRYIWKAIWNFPWCFKIYNYFSTIPRGNPNDVLRNPQVTRKADWGEKNDLDHGHTKSPKPCARRKPVLSGKGPIFSEDAYFVQKNKL